MEQASVTNKQTNGHEFNTSLAELISLMGLCLN